MASVIKRKGKNTWYACWKQNGRSVMKSTKIDIKQPGLTEKKTQQMAATVAEAMERAAKGELPANRACEAVRHAVSLVGETQRIPTLRDYLTNFPCPGSPKHQELQRRIFRQFIDCLGARADLRLDRITREDCVAFIRSQLNKYSLSTIRTNKGTLTHAFNCAVRDNLIMKSPFFMVEVREEAKCLCPEKLKKVQHLEAFTADEVAFMIRNFPAPWNDIVLVCVGTGGQRIGDIVCLQWEHIDFDAGMIRFNTQKTTYDINNPMSQALSSRLRELKEERDPKSPYVFPYMARRYQQGGGQVSTEFTQLLRSFGLAEQREPGAKAGGMHRVSSKTFHSLRRFAVSWMRENGVSADLCRDIVGHDSEEVERVYMRASRSKKADALNALVGAVTGEASAEPAMPDLPKYKKEA